MKTFGSLLLCFTIVITSSALAQDIVIPALVGQTGASAMFGRQESDSYTLAIEEWNAKGGINGKKIALQIEDTQTSARQVVSAFQRLALSKPPFVLGPTWLDGFQAVIPIAKRKDILLVTPSAARESLTGDDKTWPITFYHDSTTEIEVLAGELKKRNFKKIGLLYEQEPFAEMIRKLLTTQISSFAAEFGVQAGDSDFLSIIAKLKRAEIDALVIFVWDEKALLTFLQQIRATYPDLPLITVHDGDGWVRNPSFAKHVGHFLHTKFLLKDPSFIAKFEKRFGYEPTLTASNAYDAMNCVLRAMNEGFVSSAGIRKFLLTEELDTVTFGNFHFKADGRVPSKVEIVEHFESRD